MRDPELFRLYYNQTIHPELVRLDYHRRRLLRLIIFSVVFLIGVICFLMYIHVLIIALLAAIPIGIHIGFIIVRIRRFISHFKPRIVKLITDFIDDGTLFGELKYDMNRKIPKEKFLKSELFLTDAEIYDGEDYIEGRIGDVEFEMSELKVADMSKVRQSLCYVFRGIFVCAKFNAPLQGSLMVIPEDKYVFFSPKLYFSRGNQSLDSAIRHQRFRKFFKVYGHRHTKVSSILTDELMDFLIEYHQKTGGICLSVDNQYCYVAISNEKDILEPKLFKSNVSYELVREYYDDIYAALHLIEGLDISH